MIHTPSEAKRLLIDRLVAEFKSKLNDRVELVEAERVPAGYNKPSKDECWFFSVGSHELRAGSGVYVAVSKKTGQQVWSTSGGE